MTIKRKRKSIFEIKLIDISVDKIHNTGKIFVSIIEHEFYKIILKYSFKFVISDAMSIDEESNASFVSKY